MRPAKCCWRDSSSSNMSSSCRGAKEGSGGVTCISLKMEIIALKHYIGLYSSHNLGAGG